MQRFVYIHRQGHVRIGARFFLHLLIVSFVFTSIRFPFFSFILPAFFFFVNLLLTFPSAPFPKSIYYVTLCN